MWQAKRSRDFLWLEQPFTQGTIIEHPATGEPVAVCNRNEFDVRSEGLRFIGRGDVVVCRPDAPLTKAELERVGAFAELWAYVEAGAIAPAPGEHLEEPTATSLPPVEDAPAGRAAATPDAGALVDVAAFLDDDADPEFVAQVEAELVRQSQAPIGAAPTPPPRGGSESAAGFAPTPPAAPPSGANVTHIANRVTPVDARGRARVPTISASSLQGTPATVLPTGQPPEVAKHYMGGKREVEVQQSAGQAQWSGAASQAAAPPPAGGGTVARSGQPQAPLSSGAGAVPWSGAPSSAASQKPAQRRQDGSATGGAAPTPEQRKR
jgi:hypothetical protein